jgi:hypothetical protein
VAQIKEGDHVEFNWLKDEGVGTGTVSIIWPDGGEWGGKEPVAEIFLDEGCYTAVPIADLRPTA